MEPKRPTSDITCSEISPDPTPNEFGYSGPGDNYGPFAPLYDEKKNGQRPAENHDASSPSDQNQEEEKVIASPQVFKKKK